MLGIVLFFFVTTLACRGTRGIAQRIRTNTGTLARVYIHLSCHNVLAFIIISEENVRVRMRLADVWVTYNVREHADGRPTLLAVAELHFTRWETSATQREMYEIRVACKPNCVKTRDRAQRALCGVFAHSTRGGDDGLSFSFYFQHNSAARRT